jgi:hypothetical protein
MRFLKIVGVGAMLAMMSGCAMSHDAPADPQKSMADAKSLTQRSESAAIGYLPKADVRDIKQLSEGTFLQCADGYQWSGNIRATLSDGVNGSKAQETIAVAAKERGDEVEEDKLLSGRRRYSISTDEGVRLLVTVWEQGTVIDIDSASPCFKLPDDFRRPRTF